MYFFTNLWSSWWGCWACHWRRCQSSPRRPRSRCRSQWQRRSRRRRWRRGRGCRTCSRQRRRPWWSRSACWSLCTTASRGRTTPGCCSRTRWTRRWRLSGGARRRGSRPGHQTRGESVWRVENEMCFKRYWMLLKGMFTKWTVVPLMVLDFYLKNEMKMWKCCVCMCVFCLLQQLRWTDRNSFLRKTLRPIKELKKDYKWT